MHDEPRRILCQLLILYGADLYADPRRTEALLRDYCPTYGREVFVLVNAQRQHIPADLLAAPAWLPRAAFHAQLARRLEENLALTPQAATWAVAAWAAALRIDPNPPDRVWIWLKQHSPSPEAVQACRRSWRRLSPRRWQLFDHFGVQYNRLRVTLVDQRLQLAEGWQRSRQKVWRLARSPVGLALLVLFCTFVTVAAVRFDFALPVAAQPGPQVLADYYPLPRSAWVHAGPLTIRSGPSTQMTPLGLLPVEEAVQVVGFSPDGRWSQIEQPQAGWVNNRFLRFHNEDTPPQATILWNGQGWVAGGPVNVRAGPGLEHPVIETLTGDQSVTLLATDLSGGWSEIGRPVHGWVHSGLLQIDKDN